jgi:hypothetical protein
LAIKQVRFSDHARAEMARRDIPFEVVQQVLNNPEQVVPEHGGLVARQAHALIGGKRYRIRVVVAERRDATVVVTVY